MSFLPHAAPRRDAWFGAMGISIAAHGTLAAVLLSGAVVFLPEGQPADSRDAAFAVSLEILDAEIVEDADVIEEDRIPPDAIATLPEEMETLELEQDVAALAPGETVLQQDAPSEDITQPDGSALEPEAALAEAPPAPTEVLEPEPTEPDVLAQEPAQEIVTPDNTEPAEIAPVAPAQELAEVQPQATRPEDQPLNIDDLSLIEDDFISPLAEGGSSGTLEPEISTTEENLALLAPEPEAVAPSTLAPSTTDIPTAAAILPEVETVQPVAPIDPVTQVDPISPVDPVAPIDPVALVDPVETLDPVEETEIVPEDTPQDTEITDEAIATDPDTTIAAVPLQDVNETDIAIGQLLRRIRAVAHPQCTLALPRRAGGAPGAGVSFVGADEALLVGLSGQVTNGLVPPPVQLREIIDPRQCAVLDALRQADSYPANRIGLSLENASLQSGDSLRGRVIGAGGLYVTLLVVDDNGVVQDLAPFVTLDGNTPIVDAPVARSGPARATRQMLIAIGTTDAPLDLSDRIGQAAQDVFAPIPADTLRDMVFGLVTFDVQ